MTAVQALARLRSLGVPLVESADAAAVLGQEASATARTLARLAQAGLVDRVRHGTWWMDPPADPYRLAAHLTLPFDAYLSLQSALHHHGLIEQIPAVHYVVSLARTQRIQTCVGVYSVHHLAPEVFGGFLESAGGARIATPEKALFDVAWLSGGRSRLFAGLPELTLPSGFDHQELARWLGRVHSQRDRTRVERKVAGFVAGAQ